MEHKNVFSSTHRKQRHREHSHSQAVTTHNVQPMRIQISGKGDWRYNMKRIHRNVCPHNTHNHIETNENRGIGLASFILKKSWFYILHILNFSIF